MKSGRRGCLWLMGAALLVVGVAIALWRVSVSRELRQQRAQAEQLFAPALEALDEAALESPGVAVAYDLDATVAVIHALDAAVRDASSLQDYLEALAVCDYRGVAPEVLRAREDILRVLLERYAIQLEADQQQALWALSSDMMLSLASVVGVDVGVSAVGLPIGGISLDRQRATELLDEIKAGRERERALVRQVNALEADLFRVMMDYSEVHWRFIDEWDRLCLLRDRAYLAAHDGDWATVTAAADEAIARAPHEREAHLLKALALIESSDEEADVIGLLVDYMDEHPQSTAPALLLMGVYQARRGETRQARHSLRQAAVYYPAQAQQLTRLLDPYNQRSFLRKTREGNFILGLYKSSMLGAAWFSPDLQLARLLFDAGDFEGGRQKVMDHFARRRSQGQWDLVISDIHFCQQLLGDDFLRIFPEDSYLDLIVEPALFGERLKLSVRNRSSRTLRNATLVLALQFTDMYPSDYQPFVVETEPAVLAHQVTEFSDLEVSYSLYGQRRGVDDVVQHRAILVSNEAVTWVDTDDYKMAEAARFHEARQSSRADATHQQLVDEVLGGLEQVARLELQSGFLDDDATFLLPRALSILKPVFRLQLDGQLYQPSENLIEGDHIRLTFKDVYDFDEHRPPLTLLVDSVLSDLAIEWICDSFGCRLEGVAR